MACIDIFTGISYMFQFREEYFRNPTTFDEIERFISIYNPNEVLIVYRNFKDNEVNDIINFSGIRCESIRKVNIDEKTNST